MSSALSLKDFESDSFALDKYVEKLAQLDPTTGLGPLGNSKVKPFDATVLLRSFQTSMVVLKELAEKNERRVEKLEQVCSKQQKEHAVKLKDLEGIYADAKSEFQVLEDRITYVATKVVHLGDQLETLNSCMLRDLEAQDVMKHVAEFEQKAKPTVGVFTDPSRRLQAAELISKLNNLAVELPKTTKYDAIREHIRDRYTETEKQLVKGFMEAQNYLDVKRMKEYAQALQTFQKGLNDVIEFYIDKNLPNPSASSVPSLDDIIAQVETQCDKANTQAKQVFESPDLIMGQFIDTVIHRVVERYIDKELSSLSASDSEREKYLNKLLVTYDRAMQLQTKLSCFVTDGSYLAKEFRTKLFGKYLSGYARHEIENLEDVCLQVTQSFNDAASRAEHSGYVSQSQLGERDEDRYISQDVCVTVLDGTKGVMRRAQVLLSGSDLADLAKQTFFTVLGHLCTQHFLYALDRVSSADPASGLFVKVVGSINSNMHLIEKQFRENIMPHCIHYPSVASQCIEKKREITRKLEEKIETGLERSLSGMVARIKTILTDNQKKTDYKPEMIVVTNYTQACVRTSTYISQCCNVFKTSLDGKNLEVVLAEFGCEIYGVLYEHIQHFAVSDTGAMTLICDMNEYKKVMKEFKNPFLDEMFDNLQILCNIFIVKADNLKQVCSEDPYVNFDKGVLMSMIELRADYKASKLGKLFT
ncbi:hypothetical protein EMCRGX_G032725 [Ephydatia muelleri]|eukprot:Em0019g1203a